ncbi:MAG TPA: hypothetical protein VEJ18_18390 [Planctomycetota bacterium]|nr:hypothetical protein [Planctomycetota bacterium]
MRNLALAAAVLAWAGCAGSGGLYPDTDVVEPPGFEIKVATGVVKSGGLMQTGTLEYSGSGELTEAFREYVASMRGAGWTSASDDIGVGKAVGTLRKDNRTCALEFVSMQGQLRATIKITPTK